ncbi:twin-arginine translocase TatA/TatE family subunit [Collinsella ihumii]|uniref:twin-arginine translocase TatA/TatE family subunit n=1 Tax=Collinsella ihumii TaxID=1720204 RepID=UPI000834258A|nr:twin-arginine translocase TatA/TatE family subunit [Collinsella ihumii]
MPSIGGTELVIILVFAFLLFGPDKLPQMGHTIGRALRQFRQTQEKLTNVVQTEVVDPMAAAASAPKAKAAEQAAVDDEDADLDASEGAEAAAQPEAPASAEPEAEAEPAVQTTEDLYARRPRKHRASKAAQAEDSTDSVEGGEQ